MTDPEPRAPCAPIDPRIYEVLEAFSRLGDLLEPHVKTLIPGAHNDLFAALSDIAYCLNRIEEDHEDREDVPATAEARTEDPK